MSPMQARLYQGVQLMGETALDKLPDIETAVKGLPVWAAFTVGNALKIVPRLLPTVAPQVHTAISKATDEQIADGLNMALTVIHSILDASQTEEVTPDGSSHDGATIEDPISAAVNADDAAERAASIHAA